MSEVGTTVDDLTEARKGNYTDKTKLKKYLTCMFKKMNFVNDEGVFDVSAMKSFVPDNIRDRTAAMAVIDECLSKPGETVEDKVLAAFRCYREKRSTHFDFV